MWWAKRPYPGNFGDILNPYVIEKVTGRIPRYTPCGKGLMAIGSTIKFVEKGTHVWGTGCSRRSDPIDPHAIFHAVRGPLTRNVVRQSGGFCGDVYGDAALLLPMFFDPPVTKQHKLGYIPHYTHWDEPVETDAKRLDVRCVSYAEIEDFITQLKECEAVVSTSLHGIIVANAYGIPARWATFSASRNQVSGDGMKYEDYFLSVGMPVQTPLDLSAQPVLDSARMLEAMDRTVDLKINLQRLLNVCPTSLPA